MHKFFGAAAFIMVGITLLSVGEIEAADTSLVDLLRTKGIISSQEADQLKAETTNSLVSIKGAKLRLGGELEVEYVDAGKDAKYPQGHFQLDKFALESLVSFNEHNISFKGTLEFNESGSVVKEGFVKFEKMPLDSFLSVGIFSRFISYSRKTELYPMIDTILFRTESTQAAWEGRILPFCWGISFSDGFKLGTKQVAEDASYKMLSDSRNVGVKTGYPEWGLKIGSEQKIAKGTLDILAFGFVSELNGDDINELKDKLSGYTSNSTNMNRYGGRLTYKKKDVTLIGEIAEMEDGALTRNGWYVLLSKKYSTGKKIYFRSVEPLISYEELTADGLKSFSKPASWSRQMITIALITEIACGVQLKTEYYINDENTGGDEVENNEFLAQLEYRF